MNILYFLLPLSGVIVIIGLVIFRWASKNGQYDNLDQAAHSILFEDDDEPPAQK